MPPPEPRTRAMNCPKLSHEAAIANATAEARNQANTHVDETPEAASKPQPKSGARARYNT